MIYCPHQLSCSRDIYSIIQNVSQDIKHYYRNVSSLAERPIIITRNKEIRAFSHMIASNISSSVKEFITVGKVQNAELNELSYPDKLLNFFSGNASIVKHKLCSKGGQIVFIQKNVGHTLLWHRIRSKAY